MALISRVPIPILHIILTQAEKSLAKKGGKGKRRERDSVIYATMDRQCTLPLFLPFSSPFSFTLTRQRLGVEPWAYLQDVVLRLPATPAGQLGDLLPKHWQAVSQAKTATPQSPVTETAKD